MEAGELICADGNTSVIDFGSTLLKILLYFTQFAVGKSLALSCSFNQLYLAGNLHILELSSFF